jgi:hypothetical protein
VLKSPAPLRGHRGSRIADLVIVVIFSASAVCLPLRGNRAT